MQATILVVDDTPSNITVLMVTHEPDMAAFEDDRLRPLHAPILPGARIGAPP